VVAGGAVSSGVGEVGAVVGVVCGVDSGGVPTLSVTTGVFANGSAAVGDCVGDAVASYLSVTTGTR